MMTSTMRCRTPNAYVHPFIQMYICIYVCACVYKKSKQIKKWVCWIMKWASVIVGDECRLPASSSAKMHKPQVIHWNRQVFTINFSRNCMAKQHIYVNGATNKYTRICCWCEQLHTGVYTNSLNAILTLLWRTKEKIRNIYITTLR